MADLEVLDAVEPEVPAEGDGVIWSPSRLALAGKCGAAYKFQYVDKLRSPQTGALLVGNVVHDGVDVWYEVGHHETDLAALFRRQWQSQLLPGMWDLIKQMDAMQTELNALSQFIKLKRPSLKKPETTKEYLESKHFEAFNDAKVAMLELTPEDANEWSKTENPWQAFLTTMKIAANIERRWKQQPKPPLVEASFTIELGGFQIRGRIDQLRADVNTSGVVENTLNDIKTGKNPLTPMEAFLQAYLYYEGIKFIAAESGIPTTDRVAFYLARYDEYQLGKVDPERHRKMAINIIASRAAMIERKDYAPSYGYWCKMCNFNGACADDLSIWDFDTDGRTIDLVRE